MVEIERVLNLDGYLMTYQEECEEMLKNLLLGDSNPDKIPFR